MAAERNSTVVQHLPRPIVKKRWRIYLRVFLPSLIAVLVVFLAIAGYISYQIIFPEVKNEGDPVRFLLRSYEQFHVPGSGSSAWLLKGTPGEPAVFLCHDYAYNRLSGLNLAGLLHEKGYSVFMLSFRGHNGENSGGTALGLLEGSDLAGAIDYALLHSGVDQKSVGVWGVGLGAHAALRAALGDPRVRVLVLDSPYPSVREFLDHQVRRRLGFRSSVFSSTVGLVAAVYSRRTPLALYEEFSPGPLRDASVLFLAGSDNLVFRDWTERLHAACTGDKEIRVLPRTRRSFLSTPEGAEYDQQVSAYFEAHLPVRSVLKR
jgi:hypothetical protein